MKKHHWHAFWHEKLFEKHPNHTAKQALSVLLIIKVED
jgi:hypothetical protein